MYIEEIILDGFKSYQKRTVVGRFNPKFNAITGLNGSGKSNILDSICFVLGITNLSQIRVNKLEELVYKSGQAGISKASVSIIFNNEDKSNSSPLYKDFDKITVTRQIATGGRNRYLLNGNVVKPIEITNFFHSVQLNVNNSHFLIMQGRITKVINMKPKELLSMVEEAAGTRMYETKKQQSLKLIEKKDIKLEEINRMLEEDIIPKLERLKKERSDYLKWNSINEEIELIERYCTLHNYNNLSSEVSEVEEKLNSSELKLIGIEKAISDGQEKIKNFKKLVEEEENKLSTEWSTPLKICKERISNVESKVRLTQVQLNELKMDLSEEENLLKDYLNQKKIIEDKLNPLCVTSNQENLIQKSEEFFKLEKQIKNLKEKMEANKKSLQGIRAGCDINLSSSEQKSLRQSLYDTEKELAKLSVQEKKVKIKIGEIEKKIKILNEQLMRNSSVSNKHKSMTPKEEYEYLNNQIKKLESEIIHLKEDAELCEKYNLEKNKIKLDNDSMEIQLQPIEMFVRTRQCIYNLGASNELAIQAHINEVDTLIDYSKAQKTKVKGSVFELIDYLDYKYSTALEMIAGGRLYNLVVENHETGKKLLSTGLIKKRITIIPLDKILDPSIPEKKLNLARSLINCSSKDDFRVLSAMNILKFDKEIEPAIKFCFGHTLICEDENIAKMITFNAKISARTVTLNGDIYDPSGTLSGGSVPNNQRSILSAYKQYNDLRLKILKNNERIKEINKILADLGKSADAYRHSLIQLDINKHQLKLLEERIIRLKEESAESKIETYLKEIKALRNEHQDLLNKETFLKENKSRLENEINVFEDTKESKERHLEAEVDHLKKEIGDLSVAYKNLEKMTFNTRIEQKALKTELGQILDLILSKTNNISEIGQKIREQNEILKNLQFELDENKSSLMKLQLEIESSNDIIKENKSEIKKIEKLISSKQIENSKTIHEIKTFKTELSQKNKLKDSMSRRFEWLLDKSFINKIDLEANSYKNCIEKLEELQCEQISLSKNVNRRILNLYERVNAECNELINKRDIVIKDKDKIEDVISDLDQKKRQALENTWRAVNSSFKSIFSTLLPNSSAELVPYVNPETNVESFYEGLEFKVGLGGIWKNSLSELSGGQRSLLALSLILSMLRFKPAPVYILDEIDSALDLSHTQNIGKMIKDHFPNSQFIIVSLKEGMFNKADVLFKSELINGVSTVSRIENFSSESECHKKLENCDEIVNNSKIRRKINI
ncbi:condensin complex component SMC2 [Cryptosporidium sp. chipmunk genotype I]|uniref:condensin complex component SMC2 n=1 Tax=Cryptosporidium sp. chipmunk genotype I TaxID=1280935 RepID=UPI00351A499D|nr:condensin complex component SMC2 [Cryptosporidium sp. chipmunk genotype I]